MLTLVGFGLAWGDDCPSFDAALNEAQQAIVAYRSNDADAALAQALVAVGCAPVDDVAKLSALLRAMGARRFFDDDAAGADRYFASAKSLDAQTFEDDLWKDAALRLWFKANVRQWGVGRLEAGGSATQAWVQGASITFPAEVAAVPILARDESGHAWLLDVPVDGVVAVAAERKPAPPKVEPKATSQPVASKPEPKVEPPPKATSQPVASKPEPKAPRVRRPVRRGVSTGVVVGSAALAGRRPATRRSGAPEWLTGARFGLASTRGHATV
jgi:hypothetical protein